MALIDNLVSYWKLDESSGNAADAHGSNTLTNTLSVPYGAGFINNGAQFASASVKYLSIADASQTGLDITGNLSTSFWVNFSTIPTIDETVTRLYSKSDATGNQRGYYFMLYKTGGVIYLYFVLSNDGTATIAAQAAWTPSTSTWYHIVVAYIASAHSVQFYVNGSAQGAAQDITYTSIFNNSSPFYLASYLGATNIGDGTIDEFGIWNKTLSSTEVTALYNGGAGLAYPLSIGSATVNFLTLLGVGS